MADQKHRAGIIGDHLLKQIQCFQIEIVGRFVEHQKIGGLRQRLRKQQARAFAPRKYAYRRLCLFRQEEKVLHVTDDMAGLAADFHFVAAAACQNRRQRCFEVEQGARLVERRERQIGAENELPHIGLKATCQQIDQRRLARTVRPDDADAVAAQNADRKIVDHRLFAIGLGDMCGLDHTRAGIPRFADGEFHLPHPLARFAPSAAQIRQLRHATNIALAPGRDSITDPMFLGRNLAILLVALALFFLE